jgi:hypothetical protein
MINASILTILQLKDSDFPTSDNNTSSRKKAKVQRLMDYFILKSCSVQTIRIEQFSYICAY